MKIKSKLQFPVALAIMSFAVFSMIFQGCEKDYDELLPDKSEIENSIEFQEYIKANIELFFEYQEANSIIKDSTKFIETGIAPNGAKYRSYSFKRNHDLLKKVSATREAFIQKFPTYKYYQDKSKKELIEQSISKSETINSFLIKRGIKKEQPSLRLKSGDIEEYGTYNYDNFMEAFMDAMCYTETYGVECGGFVFADGTAILYINSNATDNHIGLPVPECVDDGTGLIVSFYQGDVITSTYHTHLYHSTFSVQDYYSQGEYFPNSNIIILFDNEIYIYPFEYGEYIHIP